jgi:DnaJ domain
MYRSGLEYRQPRDPYEILGMPRSATNEDIKTGFRRLAKQLHPDANASDPGATERFVELNAAHEILGNRRKRQAFDRGEIDARGRPVRRAISHSTSRRRSRSGGRHFATRVIIAASILVATPIFLVGGMLAPRNLTTMSVGHHGIASGFGVDDAHASTALGDQPYRRVVVTSSDAAQSNPPVMPAATNAAYVNVDTQADARQRIHDVKSCGARSQDVDQLIAMSERFLAQGDVATARRFLERAAQARDARATLMLAATYDPEGLRTMGVVGIQPDLQQAHFWYSRALEFGCREASLRLMDLAQLTR